MDNGNKLKWMIGTHGNVGCTMTWNNQGIEMTQKITGFLQGLARTQIPTNKNDALEFPTFGEIAGVNHTVVQWCSLALEEPP